MVSAMIMMILIVDLLQSATPESTQLRSLCSFDKPAS